MMDPLQDPPDAQLRLEPDQASTEPASNLNGTPADIEMSEDVAPPEPAFGAPVPTAESSLTTAPTDTLASTNEPTPSIPITSTATPPAPAVASPGPTQMAPSGARNSSNPPTTPSAPATLAPPPAPSPHGSPTRVYLNQNVTPHLLEGMKYLANYEPEKPLKWLAEFLGEKSREIEGT